MFLCWLRPAKRWSFLLRHQQRSLSVSGWMVTEKYCMYSVDILESPYWGKMSKKECDAQPRPLFQRLIHPHEFSWLKLNVTAATPQHRFLVMKALNTKLFPGQQWDLTHQHRISVSQTSCGWVQFADIIMIGIQHAGAHISVSLSLALFFVCFLSLLQNTKIKMTSSFLFSCQIWVLKPVHARKIFTLLIIQKRFF